MASNGAGRHIILGCFCQRRQADSVPKGLLRHCEYELFLGVILAYTERMSQEPRLIDSFGRTIDYVRVSVTDRCNLRCTYCMSEHMTFMPKADLLSLDELDRVCTAFVHRGVKHLRLTGGEPLVRRDFMTLVRALSRHLASGELKELTLTTNGVRLAEFAA